MQAFCLDVPMQEDETCIRRRGYSILPKEDSGCRSGIINSIKTHKKVEWIIPLACDRCGSDKNNVVPVPVTQSGYATDEATGFDALLCPECRMDV
jgi:hypothetical protein